MVFTTTVYYTKYIQFTKLYKIYAVRLSTKYLHDICSSDMYKIITKSFLRNPIVRYMYRVCYICRFLQIPAESYIFTGKTEMTQNVRDGKFLRLTGARYFTVSVRKRRVAVWKNVAFVVKGIQSVFEYSPCAYLVVGATKYAKFCFCLSL